MSNELLNNSIPDILAYEKQFPACARCTAGYEACTQYFTGFVPVLSVLGENKALVLTYKRCRFNEKVYDEDK